MNEKERIIELVKQNVISMEEALDLLEAAANNDIKTDSTQAEEATEDNKKTAESKFNRVLDDVINQSKDFAKNMEDYFSQDSEVDSEEATSQKVNQAKIIQIDREIQELNEQFDKRNEALIICNQRLREIEIFEDLEDLTPEMAEQKAAHLERKEKVQDELDALQSQIDERIREKEALGWSSHSSKKDFKDFINHSSEKFSEAASHFGKEASREGKRWGAFISEQSKTFLDNFNLKDINVSFQVPWIKTSTQEYEFVYPMDDVKAFEIEVYNGSVELEGYEGDELLIEADVRFHGNHEETSKEHFEAMNTIGIIDQRFVLKVTSPKFSLDAVIKVPQADYDKLSVNLLNGDINLEKLAIQEILLKDKNGDVNLTSVGASELTVDLLNGDIEMNDAPIDTVVINNLNGDIRINGYIRNLAAETLNSDFFLTKLDTDDANVKIKTVSGDVKLSLPSNLNLTIDSKTTHGEVKNRLSNLESIEEHPSKLKAHYHRIVSGETNNALVNITTTSGDIFLKDSKKTL